MAYLDDSPVSCALAPQQPQCNCTLDFIRYSKNQCMAGDYDYARGRAMHQLAAPEYQAFLSYMCPAWGGGPSGSAAPPDGTSPAICARPVLGTYDDHDYGWNNGNGRLPGKDRFKALFLDALGEPGGSARRNAGVGLQASYTLNAGQAGREVEVVVTDGRYYRDTLPCELRRQWCQRVVAQGAGADMYAWCADFLGGGSGGIDPASPSTPSGSCCFKDEQLAAWCKAAAPSHALYSAACDPTSAVFAATPLVLDTRNASDPAQWELRDAGGAEWRQGDAAAVSRVWPWLAQESPVCEMLGRAQRAWLAQRLAASTAPLKLVASGSVPFGSVDYASPDGNYCSGDDWNCYSRAQVNFLHTVANTSGCVVLLTGDYHYGDIKMVRPGVDQAYAGRLSSAALRQPVYQVMASGMTESTANGCNARTMPCNGTYFEDTVGLRPGGRCAFTGRPHFGMVEVDWGARVAHLQIRDAEGGGVAKTCMGDVTLQLSISLDTCLPVTA